MQQANTYSLSFKEVKTYLFALVFVAGNILLPQLCHFIPKGGLIFLPIYFFTLVGAYRFGRNVGVLTALLSPLVNCFFFGMPPVASLPAIMIKSMALALIASTISSHYRRTTLLLVLASVIGYQLVGMGFEFAQGLYNGSTASESFIHALQDVRIGFPGLLIQVFVGWFVIKKLTR